MLLTMTVTVELRELRIVVLLYVLMFDALDVTLCYRIFTCNGLVK